MGLRVDCLVSENAQLRTRNGVSKHCKGECAIPHFDWYSDSFILLMAEWWMRW
jgi:hypothetical protein